MTDRRTFIETIACGILAVPIVAYAQPPPRNARVGYLNSSPRELQATSTLIFFASLAEFGYVEGKTVVIDFRHAATDEGLRDRATELVGAGAQVIFAANPYALRAARAVTKTLPIVGYDYEEDPVAAGYAASLARPGGNVTGVFLDQAEVSAKQLQLLKEIVPGMTRVAALWDAPLATAQLKAVEDAGRRLGIAVSPIVWHGSDALPEALRAATLSGVQGLIVLSTPRIGDGHRGAVADAALKSRLPAIGLTSEFATDGLLVAYGPMRRDMYRIAASLVAKILGGARPADLPIERPVRFSLAINGKTAKALGITIPQSLLLRADEVIQ